MADVELKPCPFCGGNGKLCIGSHVCFVKCQLCGAETGLIEVSAKYSAEKRAIEMWNKRAETKGGE